LLASTAVGASERAMDELSRQLELRDQTIIELIERVQTLEQRVKAGKLKKNEQIRSQKQRADSSQPPGTIRVNEEVAERALERSLTLEGALLLPAGAIELEPGIRFSRRENSSPDFFSTGTQIYPSKTELRVNTLRSRLSFKLGLPFDSQFEMGLPYYATDIQRATKLNFTAVESNRTRQDRWGDLSLALAKTLSREGWWRPNLVGKIAWDSDTGHSNSFQEYSASITASKRQDPLTLIGSILYQTTIKKDDLKPGDVLSASFGNLIALSPETSMRFLFSGSYQDYTSENKRAHPASDRLSASFIVGGSLLLAPGRMLSIALGIGLTEESEKFSLDMSLPIRF